MTVNVTRTRSLTGCHEQFTNKLNDAPVYKDMNSFLEILIFAAQNTDFSWLQPVIDLPWFSVTVVRCGTMVYLSVYRKLFTKKQKSSNMVCRFDFPKKNLNHTVPAVMQVNATQMEARMLLRRTCSRVPNLNSYFLMYFRCNHDVTVLVDGAHKMRYATKYAAKRGRYELLNEVNEY